MEDIDIEKEMYKKSLYYHIKEMLEDNGEEFITIGRVIDIVYDCIFPDDED